VFGTESILVIGNEENVQGMGVGWRGRTAWVEVAKDWKT